MEEPKRLTEQLNRTIESVFCADDAKKLTSIVLDWAKHVDGKQIMDTLRPLLRECERQGNARFLRKVLSNFFLLLPDPWQTNAIAKCLHSDHTPSAEERDHACKLFNVFS
jgi:hypothetical protein